MAAKGNKENEIGEDTNKKRNTQKPKRFDGCVSGTGLSMIEPDPDNSLSPSPLQERNGNLATTAQVRDDAKKSSTPSTPVSTPVNSTPNSTGEQAKFSPNTSHITPKSDLKTSRGCQLLTEAISTLKNENNGMKIYKRKSDGDGIERSKSLKFAERPWQYSVVHNQALEALMNKEEELLNLRVENNILQEDKAAKDAEIETLKREIEDMKAGKTAAKRLPRVTSNKLIMNLDELAAFDSKLKKKAEYLGAITDDLNKYGINMVLESYLGYKFTTEYNIEALKKEGLLAMDGTGSLFLSTVREFSQAKYNETLDKEYDFVDLYKALAKKHFTNRVNADSNYKFNHRGDESKVAIVQKRFEATKKLKVAAGLTVHNVQPKKSVAEERERKAANKLKKDKSNKQPKDKTSDEADDHNA